MPVMEFRVFPQQKREDERTDRSPQFGKRQGPPQRPISVSRSDLAKATALSLGAIVLAYLVADPF